MPCALSSAYCSLSFWLFLLYASPIIDGIVKCDGAVDIEENYTGLIYSSKNVTSTLMIKVITATLQLPPTYYEPLKTTSTRFACYVRRPEQ